MPVEHEGEGQLVLRKHCAKLLIQAEKVGLLSQIEATKEEIVTQPLEELLHK